jgi:hypothetical protein
MNLEEILNPTILYYNVLKEVFNFLLKGLSWQLVFQNLIELPNLIGFSGYDIN